MNWVKIIKNVEWMESFVEKDKVYLICSLYNSGDGASYEIIFRDYLSRITTGSDWDPGVRTLVDHYDFIREIIQPERLNEKTSVEDDAIV